MVQIILEQNDIKAVVKKPVKRNGVISIGNQFNGKDVTVYVTVDGDSTDV